LNFPLQSTNLFQDGTRNSFIHVSAFMHVVRANLSGRRLHPIRFSFVPFAPFRGHPNLSFQVSSLSLRALRLFAAIPLLSLFLDCCVPLS
jgi:hypothetical protein